MNIGGRKVETVRPWSLLGFSGSLVAGIAMWTVILLIAFRL